MTLVLATAAVIIVGIIWAWAYAWLIKRSKRKMTFDIKHLTFPILLFTVTMTGLLTYGQVKWEAGPGIKITTNSHNDNVVIEVLERFFTNSPSDLKFFHTLQTNWVPVETLTGKREVGIVISNTYARVMWNWKTNDYIQESVVVGQALEREFQWPHYPTNVNIIIMPSYTNWWPRGLTNPAN